MPRERIPNLGQVGLNSDIAPTLLPPNVVTTLYNVMPVDGSLCSVNGEVKLFDLNIEPLYHVTHQVFTAGEPAGRQWIIVSDGNSVLAYHLASDGTLTKENITPTSGSPIGYAGGRVSFTNLNGILIANSTTAGPFYWPGPGNPTVRPLEPLPGWDPTWLCTEMIAHRYGLFALGMTEGTNYYPYKIRWSNSAQEGALPTSWDETDLTKDAGDDLLGETPGRIIAGARIRGQLYIIKEDAVYRARRVDGDYIYAIERLQGTIGTSAPEGWAELQGTLALLTSTDLLVFDGQRQISITDGVLRNSLFNSIKEEYWERCQLYYHAPTEHLFVAIVGKGDRLTDAYVYDSVNKTWGHRTLNNAYGFDTAYMALTDNGVPRWDDFPSAQQLTNAVPRWNQSGTWDQQTESSWNKGVYQPSVPDILIYESMDPDDGSTRKYWVSLILGNRNLNSTGEPKNCTARRTGMLINGADRLAQITDVWFELVGTAGVKLRVGAQEVKDGSISWSPYYDVSPQDMVHVDPRLTGRFLAWEIQSQNDNSWTLSALTFNWESAGER